MIEEIFSASNKVNSAQVAKLNVAKNRVRGAISKFNASGFKKPNIKTTQALRQNLKDCLLQARSELRVECFDDFLDWYSTILKTVDVPLRKQAGHYEDLSGFSLKSSEVQFDKEIKWVTEYINLHKELVEDFLSSIFEIERLVIRNELSKAIDCLDQMNEKYGHSFWSVQLKIALVQLSGGLEGQKALIQEYRAKHRQGVLSYIAYFTGVRNEGRTTWSHFAESIDNQLNTAQYPSDVYAYLRYRLLAEFPEIDTDLTSILRKELSNHPFDVYETLISCLQEVYLKDHFKHLRPSCKAAIARLSIQSDFRIEKLSLAMGLVQGKTELDLRDNSLLDAFLEGSREKLKKQWKVINRQATADPWTCLYSGILHGSRGKDDLFDNKRPLKIHEMIGQILRHSPDASKIYHQWEKMCRNLNGLPFIRGLGGIDNALGLNRRHPSLDFSTLSLNSRECGSEDVFLSSAVNEKVDVTQLNYLFFKKIAGVTNQEISEVPAFTKGLSRILNQYSLKNYSECLKEISFFKAGEDEISNHFISALKLKCLVAEKNNIDAVNHIAQCVSLNGRSFLFLPIVEAMKGVSKADIKSMRGQLEPLIALHALWRVTDDDRVASTLRHELSVYIRSKKVGKPSELFDKPEFVASSNYIYFLRHVCRPSFMDLIRSFETSKEVLKERRSIVGHLSEINEARSEEYQFEVIRISNQLKIDEGMEMVDASRIHVDGEAFRRWATRNMREDYERYLALVQAGLDTKSELDELLRDVLSELSSRQAFYTPDDQADAILTDMYQKLGQQFLINSDFGLDYYLSKRIRHQSFIGLIRGPLEFENLITTRESEFGGYRPNQFWPVQLSLTPSQEERLQSVLIEFAEKFDALLIELKDNILQIKSPDKPEGVFNIPIKPRALYVTRSLAQAGMDFDGFVNSTYQLFWQSMEPCLAKAKQEISRRLKDQVSGLFSELQGQVRVLTDVPSQTAELSTVIYETSIEVQRKLDMAASWFVKPDAQPKAAQYTLSEGVEIAVQSALSMNRAFNPELKVHIQGEINLQPPDLLLLWEIIFVGIGNVTKHSGGRAGADVNITCCLSDENDLNVTITSELSQKALKEYDEATLDTIRVKISEGNIGQISRKEGGSGFMKIASVLKHTPAGKIEFGLKGDNMFFLDVAFRPTKMTVAIVNLS